MAWRGVAVDAAVPSLIAATGRFGRQTLRKSKGPYSLSISPAPPPRLSTPVLSLRKGDEYSLPLRRARLPSDVSGDQPRSSLSIDRCSPPAKDERWIRNWTRFRPICCGGAPQVAATSRKMIVVLPRVDQSGGAISIQYNWEGGRKRSTHHSSHH